MLPHGEAMPARRLFSRKNADDLFLKLMARSNVAYWNRNVAYLAVRATTRHAVGALAGLCIDSAQSGVSENARFASMIGRASREPLARKSTLTSRMAVRISAIPPAS